MPVYEFVCDTCGTDFEENRRYSDLARGQTPACPKGHRRARKVVRAPAVVFRGSGWYATVSRPKPSAKGKTEAE